MQWYQPARCATCFGVGDCARGGGTLRRRACAAGLPARALIMAAALLLPGIYATVSVAAEPPLLGYGVRSCPEYMAATTAAADGNLAELQRYEDWLTGFVSALNLALGEDVLRGSGVAAALLGTGTYCREKPDQDFFNAAMDHVRSLSSLR